MDADNGTRQHHTKKPWKRYILIVIASSVSIVILGFILPNWFYFNAPYTKYETIYGDQKVLYDNGRKLYDNNSRLEGIVVQEYWTPAFFSWERHNDNKFTIYSPAYIRQR